MLGNLYWIVHISETLKDHKDLYNVHFRLRCHTQKTRKVWCEIFHMLDLNTPAEKHCINWVILLDWLTMLNIQLRRIFLGSDADSGLKGSLIHLTLVTHWLWFYLRRVPNAFYGTKGPTTSLHYGEEMSSSFSKSLLKCLWYID